MVSFIEYDGFDVRDFNSMKLFAWIFVRCAMFIKQQGKTFDFNRQR